MKIRDLSILIGIIGIVLMMVVPIPETASGYLAHSSTFPSRL